jgi:hypothetical protein
MIASYPMGTRYSFPGGKAARGVKLTTPLHVVLRSKNEWSYTSSPQYAFMAWCSVKHRDNFTFYHYISKYLTIHPILLTFTLYTL